MPAEDAPTLSQRIDGSRLQYRPVGSGVTIDGQPFNIEFNEPVDPAQFADDISTHDEPWEMFGIPQELSEDYWSVACVLMHVEDGKATGASKMDLEVAPGWVRVYVKNDDPDADRVAQFVQAVIDEYDAEAVFYDE